MTDNTRALLEQALAALESLFSGKADIDRASRCADAIQTLRAELAKPAGKVEPAAWLYAVPGYKNAASCEQIPLDMCPQGTTEAPLYLHPPTPAWHDAPEVAALKAGRDELLAALHAMLTHMGMDEDEWNKPTFDQARAAIAKAEGRTE